MVVAVWQQLHVLPEAGRSTYTLKQFAQCCSCAVMSASLCKPLTTSIVDWTSPGSCHIEIPCTFSPLLPGRGGNTVLSLHCLSCICERVNKTMKLSSYQSSLLFPLTRTPWKGKGQAAAHPWGLAWKASIRDLLRCRDLDCSLRVYPTPLCCPRIL